MTGTKNRKLVRFAIVLFAKHVLTLDSIGSGMVLEDIYISINIGLRLRIRRLGKNRIVLDNDFWRRIALVLGVFQASVKILRIVVNDDKQASVKILRIVVNDDKSKWALFTRTLIKCKRQ